MPAHREKLVAHLEDCVDAGKEALAQTQTYKEQLEAHLLSFVEEVRAIDLDLDDTDNDAVRDALRAFEKHLDDLRADLDAQQHHFEESVDESFEKLRDASDHVTITLFGRTKAGKSTTLETLIEGDGSSIGKGALHTTTDVKPVFWPPEQSLLRVVDTPGIEGFEGAELAAKAEAFIDRSDLVCFLVTDDKASPEELERFKNIHTRGKRVVVLLNVKEGDVSLLEDAPDLVFDDEKLRGHRDRITGYLSAHLDTERVEVIPFHAHAAWRATQHPENGQALHEASRFGDVEDRLRRFAREEALAARVRSPRGVVQKYVAEIKSEVLRDYAGIFRQLKQEIKSLKNEFSTAVERFKKRGRDRLYHLKAPFHEARSSVPALVDDLIASGESGSTLDQRWEGFLEKYGIHEIEKDFRTEMTDFLEDQIEERIELQKKRADTSVDEIDSLFGNVRDIENNEEWRQNGRAGMRAAGAAAAGAAVWAAANFWNPTGWAAAGVVAASAAAGEGGRRLAKKGTDAWKAKTERELAEQRHQIVDDLRERIVAIQERIKKSCSAWLKETEAQAQQYIQAPLNDVEEASDTIWQGAKSTMDVLDEVRDRVEREWLVRAAKKTVPAIRCGDIEIESAVARKKTNAKFLVRSEKYDDPLGHCIGKGGQHKKRLKAVLGLPWVTFADARQPLEEQVARALLPAHVQQKNVTVEGTEATARMPDDEKAKAIGRGGANVRKAVELFDDLSKIHIADD